MHTDEQLIVCVMLGMAIQYVPWWTEFEHIFMVAVWLIWDQIEVTR